MSHQSEYALEEQLISELKSLGYAYVDISSEEYLLRNLKLQLQWLNETEFSPKEFERILIHLNRGNIFDRATTLRGRMLLVRDDGTNKYIKFMELENWCKNMFQVTNQVTIEGKFKNRYDVTILINGLPLVQIELKRRGLELKEAFNQINRYQRHSFGSSFGLFQFVQLFVISNGVNTKYYANNKDQSFKQTFFWTDEKNNLITQLELFTRSFLEPCHISKMIAKYTVLNQSGKFLMVLRPYQFYAIEAIVHRVTESTKNGYIWHTTGSGKTLTSFKASQVLIGLNEVHKVLFVVDRKDLDYQTSREFNAFSPGCVDATNNTASLVRQLADPQTKLIVTTIQKLNNAVFKNHFESQITHLKDQRMVFIFDECHRSQFGETHARITNYFKNAQLFGFTGTPIMAQNALSSASGKRTTAELFDTCLHTYVITDAIRDENVLRFAIDYVGTYRPTDPDGQTDTSVFGINTKEYLESDQRIEKICEYIIENHERKTHSREFNAILACTSIEVLIKYYRKFRELKEQGRHDLKIATIFSYAANEEDPGADGYNTYEEVEDDPEASPPPVYSREHLEEFIGDYNKMFNTRFSTQDSQSFYNYYNDISKKVRSKHIDLLLVVNMFLTGFDAPGLNTLYVDKNLFYHGLIQAYSRTNRILNERKSHGNIVVFRNLKEATDEAIALFSYKDAPTTVFLEPYDELVRKFNAAYARLLGIAPTVASVDEFQTDEQKFEFIVAFRDVLRILNVLNTFSEFKYEDLNATEQSIQDYKSKYLDLYERGRGGDKVSILQDVDFELSLLHRDEITVSYILKLIAHYKDAMDDEKRRFKDTIEDLLDSTPQLRSKRQLILKFIEDNLPEIPSSEEIEEEFRKYWEAERTKALNLICEEENIQLEALEKTISQYLFSEKLPLMDDIIKLLPTPPTLLKRRPVSDRITQKIIAFVDTFITDQPE